MTSPKEVLVGAILEFLAGQDLLTLADIRAALERELDGCGLDALIGLKTRLTADHGWGYYARDPLAQRIHHLLADRLLEPASTGVGIDRLAALPPGPLVIVANHLSYADANLVEVLLHRAGAVSLADRLTAIAGPKIFSSRQRRFSSLCFGTVKVPQSAEVSSDEAALSAREVAQAARRGIEAARERLRAGDALLVFAEGTRSRTGAMQQMLPGVARYLELPGTVVLPMGLIGTEELFPVGDVSIRPARVVLAVGRPLDAGALFARAGRNRGLVMDAIGLAIAATLPLSYRGVYRDESAFPEATSALDLMAR